MNPTLILAMVQAAADFTKAVAPLVRDGLALANSQDATAIHKALAELQVANDELYSRVQQKLRES